jgi:HD-like signal output (HDOD) protein
MILENLVDQCDSLPAAPTLLRDLIDQFNDENASLQDLATLMERDPAICAQLLRLANSSYFQLTEPVSTTLLALQQVGLTNARSLAISIGLMSCFSGISQGTLHAFWQHSLKTAIAASHWAKANGQSTSVAYTTGLLRAIGQLIMHINMPAQMSELDQTTGRESPARVAAETSYFGYAYTDVGAELCMRWKLPESFATTLAASGKLADGLSMDPLAALVALAAWQAWASDQTLSDSELEALWPAAVAQQAGVQLSQAARNFPSWEVAGGAAAALLTSA